MGTKKKLAIFIILISGGFAGLYAYLGTAQEAADTSYNGAYRLADGSIATIVPSTSERVRLRHHKNGKIQSLYHDGQGSFQVADGFSSRDFIATGQFKYSDQGRITGVNWIENNISSSIERIQLHSEEILFNSGELRLRGKLTLPAGEGPFPVVIMVHGSEDYSAVDYYHLPYMLAAKGIAGFKFDKRGTGSSEGDYTQHFPTLAGDVIAAIEQLKSRPDIDPDKINLAGFSQGGWIAPLVAKQTNINSIMVAFGCAVSVKREDRWGYVKRLQERGFGANEIALADKINVELEAIVDHGDDDAWDRLFLLTDQYIEEDWFQAIAGSDSLLGFIAEKAIAPSADFIPAFAWKLYSRWKRGDGPNFNRTYEPKGTLEAISTPSLWLLAGEDSSVPTLETTNILKELQAQGKPVEYKVYNDAEHGNIMFELNKDGEKQYTHYTSTYFIDTVNWFKQQNSK